MAALVPANRLAEFRETTREYFQKFIDRMRTELGDLTRPVFDLDERPDDDAVTKTNKANRRLLFYLKPYSTAEPDASHILTHIHAANFTPLSFEIMDTIMTAVNTDPLLLDPSTVFKLLLTKDIRLLYNLQPRPLEENPLFPPEVYARVYIRRVWNDPYDSIMNDAERDAVIAILHEIMESPTVPPPAKKKGGSRKKRKTRRKSKRT